jgi:hypothetical protein
MAIKKVVMKKITCIALGLRVAGAEKIAELVLF